MHKHNITCVYPFFQSFLQRFSRTFRKPLQTDQIRFGHRRSLCETVDLRGEKTGGDFGMGKKRGSTHLARRGKQPAIFYFKLQ